MFPKRGLGKIVRANPPNPGGLCGIGPEPAMGMRTKLVKIVTTVI